MKPVLTVFLLLGSAIAANADPSPLGPVGKGLPPAGNPSPAFSRPWEAWQTKANLPESLAGSVVVPVSLGNKNYVYSFGGDVVRGGREYMIDSIFIYDIAADSWRRSSVHMPGALGWGGGIACGGRVYIIGGHTGNGIVNILNIYNPADSSWAQGAPVPVPCIDQACFIYQDSLIYVLGGVRRYWDLFTDAVQIYNRNRNTWLSGTRLPRQYGCAGTGVVGNTAVLSGGINYTAGAQFVSDTTYEGMINPGNPTQITWTAITGSPFPGGTRFRVSSGTVGNQVFVGNGFRSWSQGGVSYETYSYNPSTHAWTRHANKPTAMADVANYAIMDSVLFVPGGFNDLGYIGLDVHEALNLKITAVEGSPIHQSPVISYKVSPNPFTSFAFVPGHESERFSLYDVSGRKVGVYQGDKVGWDVSPGAYFLRPENGSAKPLRIVKVR